MSHYIGNDTYSIYFGRWELTEEEISILISEFRDMDFIKNYHEEYKNKYDNQLRAYKKKHDTKLRKFRKEYRELKKLLEENQSKNEVFKLKKELEYANKKLASIKNYL